MRIAILDEQDNIIVQYDPEMFKGLLVKYTEELGDTEEAFDKLVADLRKEVLKI